MRAHARARATGSGHFEARKHRVCACRGTCKRLQFTLLMIIRGVAGFRTSGSRRRSLDGVSARGTRFAIPAASWNYLCGKSPLETVQGVSWDRFRGFQGRVILVKASKD